MNLRTLCLTLLVGGLAALSAGAAEHPLAIDPALSRIEVAVHASMDSFVGKLRQFEPHVAVDDEGRVVAARIAFHFRDVATGKESRDKAMHQWQHTDEFPDGVFQLSALEPTAGPAPGLVASGRLTFHGIVRDLKFPVSVLRDHGRYVIDGEATLDTRDFGLPVIRMLALLKVDPLVKVRFHLEGKAGS